jgi:hypothetical protein
MKSIFFLFCFFLPQAAEAFTRATFPGIVGMITLTNKVGGQVVDDDSSRLYDLMNVEPKDEMIGRGKSIKLEDQSYIQICAQRGGGEVTCSIIVKANSGRGTVSKAKNLIRFETKGEEAKLLHSMLFTDATGKFQYETTDAYFHIESDGENFISEYRTN